ncbi:hypothetical protein ACE1TH_03745 [Shouchella sp. JSM 1781072]|uniref:TcaA NTF2-like domain-containing protein n=1 Tax=Shouchella sp. JSM 1781072 TaxID=3344581 RepID=UPI0035C21E81
MYTNERQGGQKGFVVRTTKHVLPLLVMMLFLAACGYSEPENLEEINDEEVVESITTFVHDYKDEMLLAINENQTERLEEEFLIPNTSFYHALHRLKEDLQKNNSRKELVSLEVDDIWFEPEEGDYYADAHEHVQVVTGDDVEDIEREIRFHIIEGSDGTYRLYTIINENEERY